MNKKAISIRLNEKAYGILKNRCSQNDTTFIKELENCIFNSERNIIMNFKNYVKQNKSGGSYYHSIIDNLACTIMNKSSISHELANEISKDFMNKFLG